MMPQTEPQTAKTFQKHEYLIGVAFLLTFVWLLVWAFWPWKLTLTFLEDGQPVAGLKMEVIIADDNALNGKTLLTDANGQIIIPRPETDGDATVRLWFPDGMRVNTTLPVKSIAWTSFDYSSNFQQGGKLTTTKYPGSTIRHRDFPDPLPEDPPGK